MSDPIQIPSVEWDALADALKAGSGKRVDMSLWNPDIVYLAGKRNLHHRFLGAAVRWFGQDVLVEALRRVDGTPYSEAYLWGTCKRIARESA